MGVEEVLIWGVFWKNAIFVVELYVLEAELDGALVGLCLGLFTRAQTEEQVNLDKICCAKGKLTGWVGC